MLDLEQYRVGDLPTLYYVPDAITPAEEQSLLTHITASKQQWKTVSGAGTQLLPPQRPANAVPNHRCPPSSSICGQSSQQNLTS